MHPRGFLRRPWHRKKLQIGDNQFADEGEGGKKYDQKKGEVGSDVGMKAKTEVVAPCSKRFGITRLQLCAAKKGLKKRRGAINRHQRDLGGPQN